MKWIWVGTIAMASIVTFAPRANAATVLDLAEEYPATSIPGEGDTFFAQRVQALTGGSIVVQPHFDASLGYKSRQQLDAVASGAIPLANSFGGQLGDANPIFFVSSLPFLTTSTDDARLLYQLATDYYDCALAGYNQKLLFVSVWPPTGIWARTPVTTIANLQAQRFRTYDATSTEFLQLQGVTSFNMSFSQVPAALASGQINAVMSSGDGGAGRKLWQYLPAFTEINYAFPLSFATINNDVWESFDHQTQEQILAAAADTQQHQWNSTVGRVQRNYQTMLANGMTITTQITPELKASFQAAADQQIDNWKTAAGTYAEHLVKRYDQIREQRAKHPGQRETVWPVHVNFGEFRHQYCPNH